MEVIKLLVVFLFLQLTFALPFRNRIIGGDVCTSHPWLVLITDAHGRHCAGSLLNHNWVVTAAHCFDSSGMQLRLGLHNRKVPREGEQLRTCAQAKCYPNTASTDCTSCSGSPDVDSPDTTDCPSFANDIMLIKMNASITYSEIIAPVKLPTVAPSKKTQCQVMGWGSTSPSEEIYPDVPYCVSIDILNNQVCQAAYPWWHVTDKMLCAGVLEGGKDSCRGDSGGPLICGDVLQGIVSLGGYPCAQPLEPGVYAKVGSYLDWIQSIIEESTPETS
ncbi:gilatoxin-like [Sceloporus undulatus]|uniref:gilatoxin-like n=1 Tax=Sceloporus undulatus TaxID=8520 RepID=UPI001C4CD649|nr:gilatoxin-like [Sceloporus undulatus]